MRQATLLTALSTMVVVLSCVLFTGCDSTGSDAEVVYDTLYLDSIYLDTLYEVDTLYDTIYQDTLRDTITIEESPQYNFITPYLYQGFGDTPSLFYYKREGEYSSPYYPGDIDFRYYAGRRYWFFRTSKFKMAQPY